VENKAFQDYYPEEFAHCYGCGPLNRDGLQIKSYWDGEEAVCHFTPNPYHSGGVPGFAYGSLIASLIDCHGAATASAAKLREKGYALGGEKSGHVILGDHITTGDGMLTGLVILKILKASQERFSKLRSVLKPYPQVMENVPVREKRPILEMEGVVRAMKRAEEKLGADGRILVRYSGTEMKARVMVEGKDQSEIEAICQRISEAIRSEVG